jgi:hypothetical protein
MTRIGLRNSVRYYNPAFSIQEVKNIGNEENGRNGGNGGNKGNRENKKKDEPRNLNVSENPKNRLPSNIEFPLKIRPLNIYDINA